MSLPFGETVTLLDPAERDLRTGDEPAGGTERTVTGCAAWPLDGNGSSGDETTFRQQTVTAGYALLLPPGTEVSATTRVRLYGDLWDVVGEPARWRSQLTGREPGVQVALRKVTG